MTRTRRVSQRDAITGRRAEVAGGAAGGVGLRCAVAYVRVSQAREVMISPEIQRDAVSRWAERDAVDVVEVVEDLDLSGRSFAKRKIMAIIDRVEAGEVATVVVYNWSRFGRNTVEALVNIARIEEAGGRVVSATEPVDAESPTGRFGRTTLLAVAELQSDMIGQSWVAVMNNRVGRGLPGTGRDRYGYVYHRATVPDGRMCPRGCALGGCATGFVQDPTTAAVLERMFREYLSGRGFGKIANGLNGEGVPGPTGTAPWRVDSVGRILDSGFGAGLVFAHGEFHPGVHAPVVDAGTWAAYREQRARRSTVPARSREATWDLAGLARCGRCGGRMTTSTHRDGGRQYLLRCATESLAGSSVCGGTWMKRLDVEAAVAAWLDGWAEPIEAAVGAALSAAPRPVPDAALDRRRLERAVSDAQAGLARLADAVAQGMPMADYLAARSRKQQDLDAAAASLASVDAEAPEAPTRPEVRRLLTMWPSLSVQARRDVLAAMLTAVVVHPRGADRRVEVVPRPGLST